MRVDDLDQAVYTATSGSRRDRERSRDTSFIGMQGESGGEEERNKPSVGVLAASDDDGDDDEEDGDDANYVDIEDDEENPIIVSLFDDTIFNNVSSMLAYAKSSYNFDLAATQSRLGLDLLGTIKLVNYIRREVKEGRGQSLNVSSSTVFEDDQYLQPVLEDDALLYNLEDIFEDGANPNSAPTSSIAMPSGIAAESEAELKIKELQRNLLETQQVVLTTQQRLELAERALEVARDFDTNQYAQASSASQNSATHPKYEGNYDGAELHREMLTDKARTEAYRDFILNNPHLVKNKVVLDVGCGTSILSLFCADVGAKVVYAVDQSEEIIKKAREIVFRNGKQDIVKLFHGRIQDIHLPVQKVDIIVSEWMGYCLLFEAMFDHVIWARDRYLKPDGLMIPAQSTLYIAPFCNPDYRLSKLDFWDDVYGYDMGCFKPDVIKTIEADASLDGSHLVSAKDAFQSFNHYQARVADLSFREVPFSFKFTRDSPQLDGFAIWFDVTFIAAPESSPTTAFSRLSLSTGPEDAPTHWRQGLCLIDRKDRRDGAALSKGLECHGTISFEKEGQGKEGLDVKIAWQSEGSERGEQEWLLR